MIDLLYLSYKPDVPPDDYWDLGLLNRLFAQQLWNPVGGIEFERRQNIDEVKEGAIIVFPARNQLECLHMLNRDIKHLEWVVLILTGDEANEFPADKVEHPNMKLWVMSAHPKKTPAGARKIGSGFPPQAMEWLPKYKERAITKPLDYFFAGQVTHERRQACAQELETLQEHAVNNGLTGGFKFTEGFTQGVPHEEYYDAMASTKTAPCPSGPESPDSFRLYEALEAGAIPVVDAYSPKFQDDNYWTWFFDEEPPFPVFTDYEQMRGYISDSVQKTPALANKTFAWWQRKKRDMAYWLVEDIATLNPHKISNEALKLRDQITVIIPSSPIKDHPSTEIIEKTIADIRVHLPDCEILITLDGVRSEQDKYYDRYEDYKRRLLWLCNHEWHNVLPVVFEEHNHQANMARAVLKMVKTPTILYVEHDTPLTPDRPIQWDKLVRNIVNGTANVIRFSHESHILEEHKYLVLSENENHQGAMITKTQQWSQRPHLASTAFYRHMINTYFHPESLTMIEDVIHQIVEMDMRNGGSQAWFNWRIWIYTPTTDPDGSILRSYNLDGRKDDPKYDMIIKPVEGK